MAWYVVQKFLQLILFSQFRFVFLSVINNIHYCRKVMEFKCVYICNHFSKFCFYVYVKMKSECY
jgi:hypothetical protein